MNVQAAPSVPVLRDGDGLSREEFERRYEAMPDVKAELLDGVVYMSSPVSSGHAEPHLDLAGWLFVYRANTPGVHGADNPTTRLDSRNEPQPDVCLRIGQEFGGQSHIDQDGYVSGAPELLGEVAKSSASYDRTVKLPIYRHNGVLEFILWRVDDGAIDWFILRDSEYKPLAPGADGIIRSETFPGLWLDLEAMLHGDAAKVLRGLQMGLASSEHARFVEDLRQASIRMKSE